MSKTMNQYEKDKEMIENLTDDFDAVLSHYIEEYDDRKDVLDTAVKLAFVRMVDIKKAGEKNS